MFVFSAQKTRFIKTFNLSMFFLIPTTNVLVEKNIILANKCYEWWEIINYTY